MIHGQNFFDQPIRPYDKIRKIANGSWEDYINGCLLDYIYFKEH